MGRALFSTRYRSEPVVHQEPEPQADLYPTWSHVNSFDPDSDEFFMDAEYEAFIVDEHPQDPAPATADAAMATDGTPTEVPASRGDARVTWREVLDSSTPTVDGASATLPMRQAVPQDERTVSLTMPIDIPRTSTPSSGSDSSAPSTPPQAYSFGSIGTPHSYGISMSPPASFSPRLYTWGSRARNTVSSISPSIGRGHLLSNSSARGSFPRIISASPALRV